MSTAEAFVSMLLEIQALLIAHSLYPHVIRYINKGERK